MNTRIKIIIAAAVIIAALGIAFVLFGGSGGNVPAPAANNTGSLPPPAAENGNYAPASSSSAFTGSSASPTSSGSQSGNAFTGGNTSTSGNGSGSGSGSASGQNSGNAPAGTVPIAAQVSGGGTKTFYVKPVQSDSRGDLLLSEYSSYEIVFFPGGSFLLSLQDQDVNTARQKAEAHFLSLLKIDEQTACSLTVIENVPYSVDPVASGYDYKMSFCPGGAQPIPQ